ncbi:MAG: T9SS type A sorting domain-containing protein, partial [Saprospiraceae bacterium]|nr:T9SS type A sorting domain-containing protein [Saprospiraceae bacterium]
LVVPLQLNAGLNPPAVFLTWANPTPSDIIHRRRVKGSAGDTWVELVNITNTSLNGHFDNGLDQNETYEYAVERKTGNVTANGYAFASFFKPVVDNRGKILVFIDSTTADELGADLIFFKNDLRGEGWQPIPFKTGPFTTVQWVKNQIMSAYNADPTNVKAVLLMGNVPIPYSGSMAWDTKSDHVGAWPSDAFYGDVNGTWTDNSVNIPNTARLANRNVPGDGKFDQNTLPSAVELPVGRLDFRRLSAATFGANPVELLRKYLWKNHLWRTGQYKVPNQALVDDHLGWSGGEAFAADGYRNAIPLVGEWNVTPGEFRNPQRHLLGYGAGANGSYSSADGIGTSANFATDSIRTVFANLYGDYFGDWDFETNPLLPALLASKGSVLTVSWAGRPHWMQHGLASGETIGYCLKETQNAQYNTAYGDSNGESGTHIALLGDPTLRAKVVPPAGNVTLTSNCNRVNLHWTASPDSEVNAYLVYRSFSLDGPYLRVTPDLIFQTSWEDLSPVADTLYYSVRAVKLEVTPGGGAFYNSSTGAPKSVIFVPGTGPTAIALGGFLNCNVTSLTLGTNFTPVNSSVQWYKPNGQLHSGFTATEGGVYTVVVTAPNGCTTAAYATVYLDTLLPQINLPGNLSYNCSTPIIEFTVPDAPANVHYFFNGMEVFPGQIIALQVSSVFNVSSTANGCSKDYNITVQQDYTPPGASITHDGLILSCTHPTVQLLGNSNVQNASYFWSGFGGWTSDLQNPMVTEPGTYCLTVSGPNGCTSTSCVNVMLQSGMDLSVNVTFGGNPCNPEGRILIANASGGIEPYAYNWSIGGTDQSIQLPNGFSGTVTLTVTDALDCETISTITVAPGLEVLALSNEESAPGAADGYIDLLVLGGQAPINFVWSNGSTTEDVFGLVNGTYTVTVTGGNGCSTVLVIQLIAVGVKDVFSELGVQILPNPATDELGVYVLPAEAFLPAKAWQAGAKEGRTLRLQLADLSGRNIATQIGAQSAFFFDTSHLPNGVYVLWVEADGDRKAFKVVVGR